MVTHKDRMIRGIFLVWICITTFICLWVYFTKDVLFVHWWVLLVVIRALGLDTLIKSAGLRYINGHWEISSQSIDITWVLRLRPWLSWASIREGPLDFHERWILLEFVKLIKHRVLLHLVSREVDDSLTLIVKESCCVLRQRRSRVAELVHLAKTISVTTTAKLFEGRSALVVALIDRRFESANTTRVLVSIDWELISEFELLCLQALWCELGWVISTGVVCLLLFLIGILIVVIAGWHAKAHFTIVERAQDFVKIRWKLLMWTRFHRFWLSVVKLHRHLVLLAHNSIILEVSWHLMLVEPWERVLILFEAITSLVHGVPSLV